MTNVTGKLRVTADGEEYTLFVGFSVLAELQERHGQDVLERLDAPAGAGPGWMPPLDVIRDFFIGALQRYHAEKADRWLVDDIIAQNPNAFASLMEASFPDKPDGGRATAGNARRPRKKSA